MKTIKLKKFWEILKDRKTAQKVFLEAEKENFNVIFDLEGVEIWPSFSDELFINWIEKFWKVFKIKNASESSKAIIKFTMSTRNRLKAIA